ncbi:hypothetical protein DFH07DRAFT_974067 [Mycena maculata]|uniref:Uncharacterized protein n=1 Tax=Mycena maculata TaxID=230809 RepID=A0AAD7MG06_9AGAR|nr:hypothetical protein DFH07DRAFT_974067 [Mycena maculata]
MHQWALESTARHRLVYRVGGFGESRAARRCQTYTHSLHFLVLLVIAIRSRRAPATQVAQKAEQYFLDEHVSAVICINIQPLKVIKPDGPPLTSDVFLPEIPQSALTGRVMLSPVHFGGHLWAGISAITLTIHHREAKPQVFHLTPEDGNLQDERLLLHQDNVSVAIANLLSEALSIPTFKEALGTKMFQLPWDEFYVKLDTYLLYDGYVRYETRAF